MTASVVVTSVEWQPAPADPARDSRLAVLLLAPEPANPAPADD